MSPNRLGLVPLLPRAVAMLAVLGLLTGSAVAAPMGAAGDDRAPVDPSEAYACRSDVYPWVEGATPAGSHVAGLVEAGNGDLLFTFNAHWMEGPTAVTRWGEAPVTRVFLSRLRPGSNTWTEPERVDYPRPLQIHNAVLWDDGAGTLYQFFTVIEGQDHNDSTLEVMTSTDNGHTWSEPRMMREEWGWMFGTRPFRMSNGEVLLPVYREGGGNGVGFMISSDGFETWDEHPQPDALWPPLVIMASTVELAQPGHLLAFLRGNGGRVYQARSFDYGRTWTPAVPTDIPSPWARVALLRLDSGNLLVAHNAQTSGPRSLLRLAVSEDGGRTWPHEALVETDPDNRFDYPYLDQSSDGFVHLGYTHNTKRNMRHVVFTEEFVRSGPDIPSDTAFGRTEYRDGELAPVDECAYSPAPRPAYACRQDTHPWDPDAPPGSNHVAALAEAGNGDLLFTFGADQDWPITRTYQVRLPAGEHTFTEPEEITYEVPHQVHNAVLWNNGEGRLFNFFTTQYGSSHAQSTLDLRTSDDHGKTWSEPRVLREEFGWMFGTRPFRMSNGEVVVPVYRESFPNGVGMMISSDDFETFEVHPQDETLWPKFVLQATVVELDQPGHLLAFLRGNFDRIYQTRSFDYGRTWTPTLPTDVPGGARVALLRLASGHLLLAHTPNGRVPLRLAVSEDEGLTWPHEVLVETDTSANRFDYPYLIQSSDGFIHLGYTHRRLTMRHVVFNERFVRHGPDIPSDPEFGRTELSGGELRSVEACAYTPGGAKHEER